jgi:uncharacterized protein with ParB-like and HNH nuclease domain
MENKLNFNAEDTTVKEILFNKFKKYEVPRYQRPYSWADDQITEFWNDLITTDQPYFIGSFIFNIESEKKNGYIEIIDGQQRLLTITIFSAALRDIAKSLDEEVAKHYHRNDIIIEDYDRKGHSYRIIPGESTKDFFEQYVQSGLHDISEAKTSKKEHNIIKKNYIFLYEKITTELSKFDRKESKINFLDKIRKKVANLIVIDIQIENEEAAYEIFETTNARGIDLSVADLLKNSIFKKIPTKVNRDMAKEKWQEITNNIEATNTEVKKYIRYFWISKYSFITEKRLFREIKKEITDWEKLLDDLWALSDWFNKLIEGNESDFQTLKNGQRIFKSLFAIRLMGVSQCYVLFLSILRNYGKLKTNPLRIFQLIEKFTFQYSAICKLPGNKVERIYSRYAIKLDKIIRNNTEKKIPGKVQSLFSDLEKELKDEKPSYETFKESFLDITYKNSSKSRMLIKYILNEIDNYFRKTGEEKIDFSNVNIEHILPQNPDEKWNLTKKEIKEYVNNLGNLTLVSKKINSKVQSKIIREKISEFKKSSLPIMGELVKELESLNYAWDKDTILKRQENFAKLAYKNIWDF